MLITELYNGQGLGNQLACYVTTRVLAMDLGYDFGIMHPERFKGADFMELDFGQPVIGGFGPEGGPPTELPNGIQNYVREKSEIHPISGADIRGYDNSLRGISDHTKLDGLLQGEQYFEHRRHEIAKWLKVPLDQEIIKICGPDVCIINFRGGEYVRVKDFFLPREYWHNAVQCMLKINPNMHFIVITDDVGQARKFFPKFKVFHFSIAGDYLAINSAAYLILSNSSFAWFPAWLNTKLKFCIAPKYWGAHNKSDGYWSLKNNLTKGWNYLDRSGIILDYETCKKELDNYKLPSLQDDIIIEKFVSTPSISNAINFRGAIKKITPNPILKFYRQTINYRRYVVNYFYHQLALIKLKNEQKEYSNLSKMERNLSSKGKVYDVFYFLNELDLLEIRFEILDKYVDYFVIVEGAYTFSGKPNESSYKAKFERYSKWNHKCIHLWVEDFHSDLNLLNFAKSHPSVGNGEDYWVREFYFKECAKRALTHLHDKDIVFVSDVDEIWNPLKLESFCDFSKSVINRPIQLSYYYYLNYRSNEHRSGWTGTIVCQYQYLKDRCLNDLRSRSITHAKEIDEGGWHFTYMGGAIGAMKKLLSWDHPEYNVHIEEMINRIENGGDYAGRQIRYWIDISALPKYLIENQNKWAHLFKITDV
jgi:hypothetical protein